MSHVPDELDAIRARFTPSDPPPDAWTVYDWAKKYNVPRKTAREENERLCQAGVLERGICYGRTTPGSGRRTMVFYWLAKKES